MFRSFLTVIAGLLVSTAPASSAAAGSQSDAPLVQRIARAQVTIANLEELVNGSTESSGVKTEDTRVAQHFHNHFPNFHNHFPNFHNHHPFHNHFPNFHNHHPFHNHH